RVALQPTVNVRVTSSLFTIVRFATFPLPDDGVTEEGEETDQVTGTPAGTSFNTYVPFVQRIDGPDIDGILVIGTTSVAPLPEGSNQLLNLVSFVPPPFQETSNLP